jgi:carotenoid cleavage dioxygenase-like enzyme
VSDVVHLFGVLGHTLIVFAGTFIRNGPGQFEFGSTRFKHPFDGFAMLHGFKISGGSATYSNKFVATSQRKAALRTGTLAGFDL